MITNITPSPNAFNWSMQPFTLNGGQTPGIQTPAEDEFANPTAVNQQILGDGTGPNSSATSGLASATRGIVESFANAFFGGSGGGMGSGTMGSLPMGPGNMGGGLPPGISIGPNGIEGLIDGPFRDAMLAAMPDHSQLFSGQTGSTTPTDNSTNGNLTAQVSITDPGGITLTSSPAIPRG